ncbi:hypothetical protein ACFYO6_38590 [Streptomyces anthocyanicus]|uniref:Uncharacterized protein n=1 Tax=Streptomyces cellulosae TaxID=1968 RepID=A0ABW6JBQ6_STRCE|nr:hypothetical protein [Streptomyces sp. SM1]GHE66880.1 hypothetical protein GCM10018771_56000 [Streptomyces cellulosae]
MTGDDVLSAHVDKPLLPTVFLRTLPECYDMHLEEGRDVPRPREAAAVIPQGA